MAYFLPVDGQRQVRLSLVGLAKYDFSNNNPL